MQITPLTPSLGVEISGVDIRRLDATGFDKLRRIWLDYKVIFLRQQDITSTALAPSLEAASSGPRAVSWRGIIARPCIMQSMTTMASDVACIARPLPVLRLCQPDPSGKNYCKMIS